MEKKRVRESLKVKRKKRIKEWDAGVRLGQGCGMKAEMEMDEEVWTEEMDVKNGTKCGSGDGGEKTDR